MGYSCNAISAVIWYSALAWNVGLTIVVISRKFNEARCSDDEDETDST